MGENTLKGGTVLQKRSAVRAVKRADISCVVWASLMGRNVSISCLALVVPSHSWVGGLVYHA